MAQRPTKVVFDIGHVLIEWDPRHLYREIFGGDEDLMDDFLANVCTPEWNREQDRGRSWEEATAILIRQHPDCAELIRLYDECWEQMVPDAVAGTPEILQELQARGVKTYGLTNFSESKLTLTHKRFDFLNHFDGLVISGVERLVKPDPAIYQILLNRYDLDPADLFFVDDTPENVEAARTLGMDAHLFTGADDLRRQLVEIGLLD